MLEVIEDTCCGHNPNLSLSGFPPAGSGNELPTTDFPGTSDENDLELLVEPFHTR